MADQRAKRITYPPKRYLTSMVGTLYKLPSAEAARPRLATLGPNPSGGVAGAAKYATMSELDSNLKIICEPAVWASRDGDVCFKCRQPGHWARVCPN